MSIKSLAASRASKLSLLASIAIFGAVASAPAMSATGTATATAEIVTPLTIVKATDLVFGRFIAGAGGSVTVSTSGVRAVNGVTASGGSAPGAASFNISGQAGTAYTIDIDGSDIKLTSGANEMGLTLFSDVTGANTTSGKVANGLLSAGGTQTLYVGGTLTVNADQAGGSYSGNISAVVQYQ